MANLNYYMVLAEILVSTEYMYSLQYPCFAYTHVYPNWQVRSNPKPNNEMKGYSS